MTPHVCEFSEDSVGPQGITLRGRKSKAESWRIPDKDETPASGMMREKRESCRGQDQKESHHVFQRGVSPSQAAANPVETTSVMIS
jgi:hypothetical protein